MEPHLRGFSDLGVVDRTQIMTASFERLVSQAIIRMACRQDYHRGFSQLEDRRCWRFPDGSGQWAERRCEHESETLLHVIAAVCCIPVQLKIERRHATSDANGIEDGEE